MTLTRRQKEVLDFVTGHIRENGIAPTYEEIGKALLVSSPATVHKHLTFLEAKGLIRRQWNHSRSIELVSRQSNLCPSCGVDVIPA